jgi:hypothetical protein
MKASYRGYDIDVHRERSMGGDVLLYYSIFRQSDGYEATSGFSTGNDTVRDFIGMMKERVDNELAEDDPWEEMRSATHFDFQSDAKGEPR